MPPSVLPRLRELIARETDECIAWVGTTGHYGYGYITFDARKQLTHRVAYMIAKGDPQGMKVLHTCDNPPCINPRHLYLGTQKENVRDMMVRGRHVNPWPQKFSVEELDSFKRMVDGGMSQNEVARRYGISQSMISLWINKKRRANKWRPV